MRSTVGSHGYTMLGCDQRNGDIDEIINIS